jgi:OHCU decarboxylase
MTLDRLNALDAETAARDLRRCCGSRAWAAHMAAARPFLSVEALQAAADRIWLALGESDWREAFAAHPRIGERAGPAAGAGTAAWSVREQSSVATAETTVLDRLAAKNREYEARFGYIFIVCATGKSADQMLTMLERRLRHDAAQEIGVAADEQRKITRLRLEKLLAEDEAR